MQKTSFINILTADSLTKISISYSWYMFIQFRKKCWDLPMTEIYLRFIDYFDLSLMILDDFAMFHLGISKSNFYEAS